MQTLDEIWEGDLFKRREEAADLVGYLQSVAGRPAMRDEGHAHVLTVDTSYGQGKSYFLRRLALHMAQEHAVAFVDAWVDDLEDQPMVALAATLDSALEPWIAKAPALEAQLARFRARAGRVAKIVGIGLAKRAASFVIMGSGAEALGDVISGADNPVGDLAKDSLKDTGNDVVDNVILGFGPGMASSMEERIKRFREGKQAIDDMKAGLSDIVNVLVEANMKLPITIIIDELDRCRPTYAIKVLEELKHLFDVPGVSFVLGMHGQQLAHSVTAAYGAGFNSQAYLRRFFNRRYILREVELTPLVEKLAKDLSLDLSRLAAPLVGEMGNVRSSAAMDPARLISRYIEIGGLAARDAFQIMEVLQTTMALTGGGQLLLPLLMPLIIADVRDVPPEGLDWPTGNWSYVTYDHSRSEVQINESSPKDLFREMLAASETTTRRLMDMMNQNSASPGTVLVGEIKLNANGPILHDPARYMKVLQTVARFISA